MKLKFPRIVNWLIIGIVVFTHLNLNYWNDNTRIIANDIISYYAYLPSTFIYHDPALHFVDNAPEEVKSKVWYHTTSTGGRALKYTMGMAILYSPFFFAAHVIAPLSGFNPNGYTLPYRIALIVSCTFYLAFALYFLRKILSMFFSSTITALTTIAIVLGTNLFCYSTSEAPMTHVYSFFLFAVFIYSTIKWYEQPGYSKSILLGFLIGLISVVRPTNVLIVLFFLLWDIRSFSDLKNRFFYFIRQIKFLIPIFLCCLLMWVPQFIYWKMVSGQWFYYSYGEEGFFFLHPQIINGLFSYRKGWLLYTPMMIIALAGIPLLYKYYRPFFIPILTFTMLNIYIILSWWTWWYGGGFGQRPFIESYALLAIPLAAIIEKASGGKPYKKALTYIFIILLTGFSIFQTEQYRYGSIHWDSMSKRAYWGTFGKLHPPENFNELLEPPDYEKALKSPD